MRLSINIQPDLAAYIPNMAAFFNAFNRRISKLERPTLIQGKLTQIVMRRFEKNAHKVLRSELRKLVPQLAKVTTTSFVWQVDYEVAVTIELKTTRVYNNLAYTNISSYHH